jgi:glycosyltransferase involved in cell wall biosynthesis
VSSVQPSLSFGHAVQTAQYNELVGNTEREGLIRSTSPLQSVDSQETIFCNARYQSAKPSLSVASPYYKDDPTGWIEALTKDPRACDVEVVVVDDGTGDGPLDEKVRAAIEAWPGPAIAIRFHRNQGRSAARNRAIKAARGAYMLFIDADMLPGDADFLARYFEVIARQSSAIVFGGFTTHGVSVTPDTLLNYSLAIKNDCKPALQRESRGPFSVASNNLLVRRDVFEHEAFDDRFTGWGWEDTEWAMRAVYAGYGLTHIDNPAVHVGLDSNKAMLRKYREAGENLRRLLERHPEGYQMMGAKVARILSHVPLHAALRPICSWLSLDMFGIVPMPLRRLAMKIWRASHAAGALGRK